MGSRHAIGLVARSSASAEPASWTAAGCRPAGRCGARAPAGTVELNSYGADDDGGEPGVPDEPLGLGDLGARRRSPVPRLTRGDRDRDLAAARQLHGGRRVGGDDGVRRDVSSFRSVTAGTRSASVSSRSARVRSSPTTDGTSVSSARAEPPRRGSDDHAEHDHDREPDRERPPAAPPARRRLRDGSAVPALDRAGPCRWSAQGSGRGSGRVWGLGELPGAPAPGGRPGPGRTIRRAGGPVGELARRGTGTGVTATPSSARTRRTASARSPASSGRASGSRRVASATRSSSAGGSRRRARGRRRDLGVHVLVGHRERGVAGERRRPGEHLVEQDPGGVHVAAGVRGSAGDLLRRQVRRGCP